MSATDSYGLGWMTGEYKGVPLLYHGGNTLGFTSDFAFLPEAGLGVVVLANAQGANDFTLGVRFRLFELVYGLDSEVEPLIEFARAQLESAVAEIQSRVLAAVDPDEVEPYLGRYANEALGEIELFVDEGRLYLDVGGIPLGGAPGRRPRAGPRGTPRSTPRSRRSPWPLRGTGRGGR